MTAAPLPTIPWNVLNYTDRRPVGMMQLRQVIDNAVGGASLTSPAGIAAAGKAWIAQAKDAAARLVRINAQGMILWSQCEDIVGDELNGVAYAGETIPRSFFEPYADEYFGAFSSQGLRTGHCIRHGRIVKDYNGNWCRVPGNGVADAAGKMAYAKTRWGSTLGYLDSNTTAPNITSLSVVKKPLVVNNATVQVVTDVSFSENGEFIPSGGEMTWFSNNGVLVFAEQSTDDYYGHTFGFADCRNGIPVNRPGVPQLIAVASAIDATHHAELVALCKAGNPLMVNAWYDNPECVTTVPKIYHDAGL